MNGVERAAGNGQLNAEVGRSRIVLEGRERIRSGRALVLAAVSNRRSAGPVCAFCIQVQDEL